MRGYSSIGLINPKTNANVGGALRACACYGASLIMIQGQRYNRQASDVTAAYRHIPMVHIENIIESIPFDCIPIGVEITKDAKDLKNFTHPERALYIFGPEDGSIPNLIIEKCKYIVKINTKFCMNLAATVNVVLYDRQSKQS